MIFFESTLSNLMNKKYNFVDFLTNKKNLFSKTIKIKTKKITKNNTQPREDLRYLKP